jgi:hypothetical protein
LESICFCRGFSRIFQGGGMYYELLHPPPPPCLFCRVNKKSACLLPSVAAGFCPFRGLFCLRFLGACLTSYQVVIVAKTLYMIDISGWLLLPCPSYVRAAGRF